MMLRPLVFECDGDRLSCSKQKRRAADDSRQRAPKPGRRAVFLDRDGTLVRDTGYLARPQDVELLPGAADALANLRSLGFLSIVVSNQSGVGRGYFTVDQLQAVHRRLIELLAEVRVTLDCAYYCPHDPDRECPCRKPRVASFAAAATRFGLSLEDCVVVGDKSNDIFAGRTIGAHVVMLGGSTHSSNLGTGGASAVHAEDWGDVVRAIGGLQ